MKKGKFRKAVFAVTYALDSGKPEYVVLKRTLHWKGWEFPKGGIEFIETKSNAVQREVFEETGLKTFKIKNHKIKGKYFYPKEFKDRPGFIGQTYQLFSAKVKKSKIKVDKREHSSGKWVSYSQAMKLLTHKEQKESLRVVNDWLKNNETS